MWTLYSAKSSKGPKVGVGLVTRTNRVVKHERIHVVEHFCWVYLASPGAVLFPVLKTFSVKRPSLSQGSIGP